MISTFTKRKMRVLAAALTLSLCMSGCGVVKMEKVEEATTQTADGIDTIKEETDKENNAPPRPQDDFYGYVNMETLKSHEMNYKSERYGSDVMTQETVDAELLTMLQELVNAKETFEAGSDEQLVRDFYLQMLAYINGEKTSAADTFRELAGEIRSIKTVAEAKSMIKKLNEMGIQTGFQAGVSIDYHSGDRYAAYLYQKNTLVNADIKKLYTDDNERKQLAAYAMDVLIACGDEKAVAKEKAKNFVYSMLNIAFDTDYDVLGADNYFVANEYLTNAELDALLGNITAGELADMYGIDNPYDGWLVFDKGQQTALAKLFAEEELENLKTMMLCQCMNKLEIFLFREYPFLGNPLEDGREPEVLAIAAIGQCMDKQIGALYAKNYFTSEMETQLVQMYQDIKKSYEKLITEADWLTETTRSRCLKKLNNMVFIYGGGQEKKIDSRDKALIGADAFWTVLNLDKKEYTDSVSKLGSSIDMQESGMGAHIVNAAYSPVNKFTITVGIMHAPYFDVNADYAENLGGLGMVMAHEIGHAFDSLCIDYDENGAYHPEGIPDVDREKLDAETKKMEAYFSEFAIMKIYRVDGEKTAFENFADKGAMECLMNIAKTDDARRKLFENYARVWMALVSDEDVLWQLAEDEHSPNYARVNAILSSTDEFISLYDVKEGDGMYVKPEARVTRWKAGK